MPSHIFDPKEIHKLENPERYKWLNPNAVADLFPLSGDETLVEYGAGTGFYTVELARRVPAGKVLAVDISEELLDFFRNKLDSLDLTNIELIKSDSLPSPVPSESADAMLAINLLHELEGEWAALKDMHRILKPGGYLVALDWLAIERPAGPPIDHCLEPGRALELLEEAGFKLREEPQSATETFPYHYIYILEKA